MIYFEKVSKIYNSDTVPALEDITLSIKPKEFVSIVGHSGAGKTTLLKMLIAEEKPTTGSIFFESANIHEPVVGVPLQPQRQMNGEVKYVPMCCIHIKW